jgi:hypothetical protein
VYKEKDNYKLNYDRSQVIHIKPVVWSSKPYTLSSNLLIISDDETIDVKILIYIYIVYMQTAGHCSRAV